LFSYLGFVIFSLFTVQVTLLTSSLHAGLELPDTVLMALLEDIPPILPQFRTFSRELDFEFTVSLCSQICTGTHTAAIQCKRGAFVLLVVLGGNDS